MPTHWCLNCLSYDQVFIITNNLFNDLAWPNFSTSSEVSFPHTPDFGLDSKLQQSVWSVTSTLKLILRMGQPQRITFSVKPLRWCSLPSDCLTAPQGSFCSQLSLPIKEKSFLFNFETFADTQVRELYLLKSSFQIKSLLT